MLAREGDLIRTTDNVIFDVKGLVHPPDKVIAFPRYIPSSAGTRGKPGSLYNKVYNLAERFTYLQHKTPQLIVMDPVFGEKLCEVPTAAINKHYNPITKLQTLRKGKKLQPLESKVVMLAQELKKEANISWDSIGISGSVMAGLFTLKSDIDPTIYGSRNCRKGYAALRTLLENKTSHFKPYNRGELQELFDFRSKDTLMSFEEFREVETRKAFQGKYDGTDYFVRFVKDWSEVTEQYGDIWYENAGYAKISATIADDTNALFTPCTYTISNVNIIEGTRQQCITEVASFRGRFCQQAAVGEKVIVQGKIERVTDKKQSLQHHRVIIGNRPEDFMILSKP